MLSSLKVSTSLLGGWAAGHLHRDTFPIRAAGEPATKASGREMARSHPGALICDSTLHRRSLR